MLSNLVNPLLMVGAFSTSLAVHELGHYVAVRSIGVTVTEAGLGLPIPPYLEVKAPRITTTKLTLSPWLLGAYVVPAEEEFAAAPLLKRIWVYLAGVLFNFLLACAAFVSMSWLMYGVRLSVIFEAMQAVVTLLGIIVSAVRFKDLGSIVGAVAGANDIQTIGTNLPPALETWFTLLILINCSLIVFNLFPIPSLDGGQVVIAICKDKFNMSEKWEKRLKIASGALIATLSLWLVGKDIVHLVFR
jgi:membrane-associated protease RseP (regulator of RpoE activity)